MKKQLINIAIVGLVFAILTANPIFAQENTNTQITAPKSTLTEKSDQNLESEPKTISPKLEKELKTEISKVYGSEQTNEIYNRIIEIAQKAKSERPQNLKQDDLTRPNDWYKDEIIYMFYVDQFGTVTPDKPNQFKDTVNMLDYLKNLELQQYTCCLLQILQWKMQVLM